MIRKGTLADIPRLVELGAMMHTLSRYALMNYNALKVAALMESLINHESGGVLFVAERDGVVVGGFAGGVTVHWFSDDKVAFDYGLFIEPSQRNGLTAVKLIRAFLNYANLMNATLINLDITTASVNEDAIVRLYESQGLHRAGVLMSKWSEICA